VKRLYFGLGLLLGLGASASGPSSKLPVREILKAINEAERSVARKLGFDVSASELAPGVRWEASLVPWATRSWIIFNLGDKSLEQLRRNDDGDGKPLL